MKHLINMLLVIALAIFLVNCSENNPIITEPNDGEQLSTILPKAKTKFIGICTPTTPPEEGDNAWYDDTDDPRVTGISIWITEFVNQIDDVTFELGGTAELTVDNGLGKWEITWNGVQVLTSPDGSTFKVVAHTVGKGVEGEVRGLIAKWKYTMDFDGTPESFHYLINGRLTERI